MARSLNRTAVLAFGTMFAMLARCTYSMYNPCQTLAPISRGDAFPLGLVLVPSISASYLANLTVSNGGIYNTIFQDFLIANYNASVAIFNLRMDRLQVLKIPFPDIVFSMYMASQPRLSVVAFRGNVTSQPIYIASGNTSETNGAGFMVSTALLLRFGEWLLCAVLWAVSGAFGSCALFIIFNAVHGGKGKRLGLCIPGVGRGSTFTSLGIMVLAPPVSAPERHITLRKGPSIYPCRLRTVWAINFPALVALTFVTDIRRLPCYPADSILHCCCC
ncbi:hypothetical protein VaNZ11_004892 [Volvox africanus]|uniref:Pherophorin domain-containing protein n=1 Tax=Volvox africanus TaxID=51714 RepID=A0ABQ5RXI2_9CHLO|nr:hypothetical protein VaNZ11_004892 [Volvox africanus]